MTASVVQEKNFFASGNGANISVGFTSNNVAGNAVLNVSTWGTLTTTDFASSQDTNNTYAAVQNAVADTNNSQSIGQAVAKNIAGGANTVQSNFNNTPAFRGIYAFEIGGVTANPLDGASSNFQPAPGTGANAIVSGNGNNLNQPALMVAVSMDNGGTPAPSIGTGFTLGANGWPGGGTNQATSENERFTTTGNKQATFTGGSAAPATLTIMAIFDEGAGGGAFPGLLSVPLTFIII